MFSPFQISETDAEPCDAHLIPKALESSDRTVVSEREFDNLFGALNDSVLVRHVRNLTNDKKEVSLDFYEDATMKRLNSSPVRAKTTIERDSPTGPMKGQLSYLDGRDFPEGLKAHVNLGIGSLVKMKPYSPSVEDEARIGLSMLHSAYLTMFYHFDKEYIECENTEAVRRILRASIDDNLSAEICAIGRLQFMTTRLIERRFGANNLAKLVNEALVKDPHPVTIWNWGEFSCFGAVLRYHPNFISFAFLPGFGEFGEASYHRFQRSIESLPVQGTRVSEWPPSSKRSVRAFWEMSIRRPTRKVIRTVPAFGHSGTL